MIEIRHQLTGAAVNHIRAMDWSSASHEGKGASAGAQLDLLHGKGTATFSTGGIVSNTPSRGSYSDPKYRAPFVLMGPGRNGASGPAIRYVTILATRAGQRTVTLKPLGDNSHSFPIELVDLPNRRANIQTASP